MNRKKPFVLAALAAGFLLSACGGERARVLQTATPPAPFAPLPIDGTEANPWGEEFHPFVGGAVIDIDGDGRMEVFAGGGHGTPDSLFAWQNGRLVNIIGQTNLSDMAATHGANAVDLDDDGDTDLLLARATGVFLYVNNGGGRFEKRAIAADLPPNSAPLNVAVGDYDRDGDGDLYISNFVDFANFRSATFNDPEHAKTNILLRNDGDFAFTDVTAASGAAALQNTFLSSFVDVDGDGWQDLIVAQNTGQVEFLQNNGAGAFVPRPVKTGWGFWMGLAAGDIDQDGDQDFFFTNSGTSVPAWILELAGDGTDEQPRNYGWILLRNDGDFNLTDVTADYQLNDYGFAWGAAFEDLTLDGNLELLVAQNYIKWTPHRWLKLDGKAFVQKDGAFYDAPSLGLANPEFAQAPLIADFDNDGRPDVFWLNMEGAPRAFLNRSSGNFVTLKFADTVAAIGASAQAVVEGKRGGVRVLLNNSGFSTDGQAMLTFGLGSAEAVDEITIRWPDGHEQTIKNPAINKTVTVDRQQ